MKGYALFGLHLLMSLAITGTTVQAQTLAEFKALVPSCFSDCIKAIDKLYGCKAGDWRCTCGFDKNESDLVTYESDLTTYESPSECDATTSTDTCSTDDYNIGSAAILEICTLIYDGLSSIPGGGTSEFVSRVRAAATADAFDDYEGTATVVSVVEVTASVDGITGPVAFTTIAGPATVLHASVTPTAGAAITANNGTLAANSSTDAGSSHTSFVTSSPSAASASPQPTSISAAAAASVGRYAAGNAGALVGMAAVFAFFA